jgi:hypothetical protein
MGCTWFEGSSSDTGRSRAELASRAKPGETTLIELSPRHLPRSDPVCETTKTWRRRLYGMQRPCTVLRFSAEPECPLKRSSTISRVEVPGRLSRRISNGFSRVGGTGSRRSQASVAGSCVTRLLIDECIDERLRNSFPGHECQTARYAKLAGLKNGPYCPLPNLQDSTFWSRWIRAFPISRTSWMERSL